MLTDLHAAKGNELEDCLSDSIWSDNHQLTKLVSTDDDNLNVVNANLDDDGGTLNLQGNSDNIKANQEIPIVDSKDDWSCNILPQVKMEEFYQLIENYLVHSLQKKITEIEITYCFSKWVLHSITKYMKDRPKNTCKMSVLSQCCIEL